MNVFLCGYHWIGCAVLKQLVNAGHNVYVFTHPAQKNTPDLAALCRKMNIPYTFDNVSTAKFPFQPDVVCSIYYRNIIKKNVIEACNGKIFNLHPALLPQYRGCSSLTWAMINGEKNCGFSYYYINEKIDDGNIIVQQKIEIEPFDTQIALYYRVMFEALKYFAEAFQKVNEGYKGIPQTGEKSCYKRGCPFEGRINPEWTDEQVERFIRAMIFPPLPAAKFKNQEIYSIDEYLATKQMVGGGGSITMIGCGGHARSVADVVLNDNPFARLIFADENARDGETIFDFPVVKSLPSDAENIFVAIGDNKKRRKLANGKRLISIVAHSATVSPTAVIEDGCFIGEGAHIGPFAHIGRGTIVNTNTIVEHEVSIGVFSHLAPNTTVCGRTIIGDNVFLGAGTTVKDGIEICSDVVVGAGSVVIKDISKAGMYVGTPAKIKENQA